jgi:hypothetical protein
MPAGVARFTEINDKKRDAPYAQKLLTQPANGVKHTPNEFNPLASRQQLVTTT